MLLYCIRSTIKFSIEKACFVTYVEDHILHVKSLQVEGLLKDRNAKCYYHLVWKISINNEKWGKFNSAIASSFYGSLSALLFFKHLSIIIYLSNKDLTASSQGRKMKVGDFWAERRFGGKMTQEYSSGWCWGGRSRYSNWMRGKGPCGKPELE